MEHFKWMRHPIGFISLISLIIFFSTLLVGCLVPATGPGLGLSGSDDYYDRRNEENRRRNSILNRSRDRYSGEDCEDDDDCEDICRKIYRRPTVRDECLELPVDQVEQLEEIYEALEHPRSSNDLEDIDSDDFETFVSIDLKPLDTLIGRLKSTEGKKVLTWIAESSDIAEIFMDVDNEYDLLEKLLNSLDETTDQKALEETIDGGKSFMELAIADKGAALDWVHNFIVHKCDSEDHEEVCVFQTWYCETISSSDERSWRDLVGYENFQGVANEILSEYTISGGRPSWWTDEVEEDGVDELRDAEKFSDLCSETLVENTN